MLAFLIFRAGALLQVVPKVTNTTGSLINSKELQAHVESDAGALLREASLGDEASIGDEAGELAPVVPITDPRCTVIFVAGYCHSGTSVMQHQLLLKLGFDFEARQPETWPKKSDTCRGVTRVYKVPSDPTISRGFSSEAMSEWNQYRYVGGDRYINRLRTLKQQIPTARIVFMCRDLPNTVWSRMQRTGTTSFADMHQFQQDYCAVNHLCKGGAPAAGNFLYQVVDLEDFTQRPEAYLDAATAGLAMPNLLESGVPPGQPQDTAHEARRQWQVKQPVYAYDANAYKKEAPPEIAAKLSVLSC